MSSGAQITKLYREISNLLVRVFWAIVINHFMCLFYHSTFLEKEMAPLSETLSYEIDTHFWLLKIDFDSFATACDFVLVTLCVYHGRAYSRERPPIYQHQLSENSYRKAFKIFSDSCGKLSKYSGIPTAND